MNTPQLERALRRKYAPPEYAIVFNVADSTGGAGSRYADALAMSLWPSRGLMLSGFELKASRSDWLRELKNPEKAERICRYCDHWWIVAGATDLVRDEELPATWGLLVPRGEELVVKRKAPLLENPKPVSRGFLAAIMRRSTEQTVDKQMLEDARSEAAEAAKKSAEELHRYQRDDYQSLLKRVEAFEKASGVSIRYGWSHPAQVGAAVKAVLNGEDKQVRIRVERMKNELESILQHCDRVLQTAN